MSLWENSIFLWSMEFQLFIAKLSRLITSSSDGIMAKIFCLNISLLNLIAHANMNLTQKKDEWAGNAEARMGVFLQGGSLQVVGR